MAASGTAPAARHRVIVVGGGFGGLQTVLGLRRADVDVTLVDRRNFHLFQPLTYQVATGALSPGEVAYPLRAIFARHDAITVLLAEVEAIDLGARTVRARPQAADLPDIVMPYDTLVVAGGSAYSYFGHDEWRPFAPEIKSLESALDVRARILRAFEVAELTTSAAERRRWLTFVVVGAGPTGVEMAGQIAEIVRNVGRREFRSLDPDDARVLLVEAADRVLTTFPPSLSTRALHALETLGVTAMLGHTVVDIRADAVDVRGPDETVATIPAHTACWAAGVQASPLAGMLGEATGAEVDRAGRVVVEPDLSLPGHPEVFALGDMVQVRGADPLPGVAPVAMQQGRHVARAIRARQEGRIAPGFRYRDKGNLATIGRARAVADLHGLRLGGFLAWVTWLVVHLWYLIGFQNRLLVVIRWAFSFVSHGRGARLITGAPPTDAPR